MKKMAWAATVALAAATLVAGVPTSASADAANVRNTGGYAIGGLHYWLGQGPYYRQRNYDDLILAQSFSGYTDSTAGLYIGPGFCVREREWLNGNPNTLGPVRIIRATSTAPWWHHFGNGSYDVAAYPLGEAGCR